MIHSFQVRLDSDLDSGLDFHGLAGLPIYYSWAAMHRRCNHPADPCYHRYGGRGIKVCERWNSVHAFLEDMGHPPAGMTLGRIDNDGDYEPNNCRWETQEQQNENTSRNRFLTWRGKTQTIKAWAKEQNISPPRISERLRRGWSVERALLTPCPVGYELGRAKHLAESRRQWAKNGARYAATSDARRRGLLPPRQAAAANTPRTRGRKATPAMAAEVVALRQQGLTCREIAERLPISKSTVASLLRS